MSDIFDSQCFCEEKPPKEVFKCGNDGEKCECKGINVFALKTSNNGTELPFEEAYEQGQFEFKRSNTGTQCTTSDFRAHGFGDGIQKQCFCDDSRVHHINHYRRKRKERINREKLQAAQLLAKMLADQKKIEEADIQKKLAKIEADAKAAEAAAIAVAAVAKAAEEAAFAKAESDRATAEKAASAAKLVADAETAKDEAEALKAAATVKKAEAEAAALAKEAENASNVDKMALEL
jgi:hypothetical protein